MENKINEFEASMCAFHMALAERLLRVVEMSGKTMSADLEETPYVIPGYKYSMTYAGNERPYKFWIGANFDRLFFITRAVVSPEKAAGIFQFTFGGAESVGWKINYEKIGDNEVSIWATIKASNVLVERLISNELNDERRSVLTDAGAFFAVDIPMMIQSYIRTAQRDGVHPSLTDPTPL